MKNLVIAQSGGPTAAINATLAGIVEHALSCGDIDRIYGAQYGIKGLLNDQLTEIGALLSNPHALSQLMHTPSAALGSCRIKLPSVQEAPQDYEQIFACMAKYNIGYFIYIGGNDSMDTVVKLSQYAAAHSIDISIMGAPKTIDNDLFGMDHSPGFGSAARFIASSFTELWSDCHSYDIPAVTIVEVMGRHVGWLTASAALANTDGKAPQLLYVPEIPFDTNQFLADVRRELTKSQAVLVAVSEGIRDKDGVFVGESMQTGMVDVFGHKYLSGTGRVLEDLVRRDIGCKARALDLGLLQRCAGHLASSTDLLEAKLLGSTALDRALKGMSGQVSTLNRLSDSPYQVYYDTIDAALVANKEKKIPRSWLNEEGNYVTEDMLRYLRPLVRSAFEGGNDSGLPVHFRIDGPGEII